MSLMTREQERQELYKTIWQIANDLRGSVDGWDFKAYVFGILRPMCWGCWRTGISASRWPGS